MCRLVLTELEVQDDAWPFLLPVNTKQFPTYKKIIKNPMDLSTIHRKLRESRYRLVEEVLDDFQLIWDNCRAYNPANSVQFNTI